VGRVGRPDDVAEACLFLGDSRKSGFMTGQRMVIDGGMTTKMIYSHDFSSKDEWQKKD
jgi:NAD(P)-dependent dehydrogenase (short-subunit alcohol dehydrogenase family)